VANKIGVVPKKAEAVPKTRHPNPLCVMHGKPITWEDPECMICKALKKGSFDGKIGANDNYRNVPGRGDIP